MSIVRSRSRTSGKQPMADCNVLLVEDQVSVAQVIASTLYQRLGCKVLIATSLAQVKEVLARKEQEFFAIVSDLHLPDAEDAGVVDVLLKAGRPVIAVSGNFDDEMHDVLIGKGVAGYVLKGSANAYEYIAELLRRLHANRNVRVLVMDDSAPMRELMRHMLGMMLLQVGQARDGVEGLKALERHPEIRLVLVDLEMPNMDGITFVSKVREKWPRERLALIGISSSNEKRVSSKFLKSGANDFIAKPFSYDELVCRVNLNLQMLDTFESIRHTAYHDHLTDLFNRRYFFEHGIPAYGHAQVQELPLCVVMMDIDFFKKINDTYGHDQGDAVLVQVAAMLRQHFPNDLTARLGGEEFALLVKGRAGEVLPRVETFRRAVADASLTHGATEITFTISIGVATQPGASLDDALRQADDLLYQAKNGGRNQIVHD